MCMYIYVYVYATTYMYVLIYVCIHMYMYVSICDRSLFCLVTVLGDSRARLREILRCESIGR